MGRCGVQASWPLSETPGQQAVKTRTKYRQSTNDEGLHDTDLCSNHEKKTVLLRPHLTCLSKTLSPVQSTCN